MDIEVSEIEKEGTEVYNNGPLFPTFSNENELK